MTKIIFRVFYSNIKNIILLCGGALGVVDTTPKQAVDLLWGWRKPEWQRFSPDVEGTTSNSAIFHSLTLIRRVRACVRACDACC